MTEAFLILLFLFLGIALLNNISAVPPQKDLSKKDPPKQENLKNSQKKVFFTKKGERVRSHFEQEIADFLADQKIRYEYEKPILFGKIEIHPDFYLSDYDVFIEYFGMLGEPSYNRIISLKLDTYEKMGVKVIKLYPNNFRNFGWIIKKRFEKTLGKTFPQRKFIKYNPIS